MAGMTSWVFRRIELDSLGRAEFGKTKSKLGLYPSKHCDCHAHPADVIRMKRDLRIDICSL